MNNVLRNIAAQTIGILYFALASGCAWMQGATPGDIAGPQVVDSTLVVPNQDQAPLPEVTATPTVAFEPVPDEPQQSVLTVDGPVRPEQVSEIQAPPVTNQNTVKTMEPPLVIEQPQVKETPPVIVKTVGPPQVVEQTPVKETPPVIVKTVGPPQVVEQTPVKETPPVIVKTVEQPLIVEQTPVKETPPVIVKTVEQPLIVEQAPVKGPVPVVTRAVEPPLDVTSLQTRLRDTKAIGLFTKIALKNQVDDLLKQFKTHYQNGQKTSVTSLRQPYDMLVLKVLALIQDEDPSLARTISGSREAIWASSQTRKNLI